MRKLLPIGIALAAGLAGLALNTLRPVLFTNIEWALGGLFPLLAAALFGRWVGLVAGLTAFVLTWNYWLHPWGITTYGLEAFVVGHLMQRRGLRLFRASLLFWLLWGTPVAAVYFLNNSYLGFPSNYFALVKYPLNGLSIALVAQAIADRRFFRRLRESLGQPTPLPNLHSLLTAQFSSLTALPILIFSFLFFGVLDAKVTEQAAQRLSSKAAAIEREVTHILDVGASEWEQEFVLNQTNLPTEAQLQAWLRKRPSWTALTFQSANPRNPLVSARIPHPPANAAPFTTTLTDRDGNEAATVHSHLDLAELIRRMQLPEELLDHDMLILDAEGHPLLLPSTIGPELVPDILQTVFIDEVGMGKTDFTHDRWRPETLRVERFRCHARPITGTNWTLILEDPLWRTQSESVKLFLLSLILTLLAVALVNLLSRSTATEITTPLRQLAHHTATLGRGAPSAAPAIDAPVAVELGQIQTDVVAATEKLNQANQRLGDAIKDRDRSHEKLESVLKQMEQTVRERTADLTEALTAARAADHAKGEFLAMMSHELRTPLNVMLGSVELLLSGEFGRLSEQQIKSVDAIDANGRHLLSLIQDILDYSKDEFNQLALHPESIDPREECEQAIALIAPRAGAKNLAVRTSFQHQGTLIWADPKRLRQMVINLLSNAVKFTPEGGTVTLQVRQPAPGHLRITVSDTGIGIAPEHLADIFLPFHQIDRTLSRQFEGSGLGLTLVRRLAELHHGEVSVTSVPNEGSHFHLDLPVAPRVPAGNTTPAPTSGSADEPARSAKSGAGLDETSPVRDDETVLIVEDNATNAELIRSYLRILGFKGVIARDGVEGLELLCQISPILVLMDVQMPRMDGIEATKAIRGLPDPRLSTVPIIMVTALAMESDRQRALRAGADEYLCKPFSLTDFRETLQRYLQPRKRPN